MTAETVSGGPHPPAATPPTTLAIDVGGTGLKASVLDAAGAMVVERVRVKTAYPCPPEALVRRLHELVTPLPAYDRVAVGFPGMVRGGRVPTAPTCPGRLARVRRPHPSWPGPGPDSTWPPHSRPSWAGPPGW